MLPTLSSYQAPSSHELFRSYFWFENCSFNVINCEILHACNIEGAIENGKYKGTVNNGHQTQNEDGDRGNTNIYVK